MSEKVALTKELKYCIGQYRTAVRWLRDARTYKDKYAQNLTSTGKSWKEGNEGELAKDSVKAYNEAVSGVLYWRRKINSCNEKLMNLAGGNSGTEATRGESQGEA